MNQLFIHPNFHSRIFAIFITTSLVWGACSSPTPIDEKKPFLNSQLVVLDSYQLQTSSDTLPYIFYKKAAYEHNPDKYSQSDSTTIRFLYPLIEPLASIAVRDSINSQIKAILLQETTQYQTVEERLDGFLAEFRAHKKDMQDFGLPSSNWAFDMELSVLINNSAVFVLRIDQLEFTGGAHANSWTSYKNYHVQSGQELKLSDLFHKSSQHAWLPLARAAFWKAWQEQDSSIQKNLPEKDTSDFVLPPNFSIGLEALHFYYNPYELDAYGLKEFSFYLPYIDLLPFIDTTVLPLEAQTRSITTSN